MLLTSTVGFSQKTVKVYASYTYYAPETMSVEEAKRVALDRAKIQAIADEFGTIVSQNNSTVMSNINGASDTQFFSIGGSDVKGEWLETIDNPEYEIKYGNHLLIVTANVKGSIRERTTNSIDLDVKLLRNGTDQRYESAEFRDGDDMFLYFKSPSDGYLIIFLVDESAKNVYSILPYPQDTYSSYEIAANQEYIFFSRKMAPEQERAHVTEYTMTCGDATEINDIVVVFTPAKLQMPKLRTKKVGSQPPTLDYEEFTKWRANAMKHDDNLTIKNSTITIHK
jgi:hypothetical protein